MRSEGVPFAWAVVISSFFFSYLHAANPGFWFVPLLSIFVAGTFFVLSYHYLGNLWFCCLSHTMWNFTQDFLFGLPDSGKPAAASLLSAIPHGSSFFFDEQFGIEGSWMCILVQVCACVAVVLVGSQLRSRIEGRQGFSR